jgi:hypothetical protein
LGDLTLQPYKFGSFSGADTVPHVYGDVWEREKTPRADRLLIAPSGGHVELLIELSRCLEEPFGILYVLVVDRSGKEEARYQSPWPVERREAEDFLRGFSRFLESDGRHHLWISSVPDRATLVYDRHNILYAYGPLELYEKVLVARGMREGSVRFPVPHTHHYNAELDEEEDRMMSVWPWKEFPLGEED